MTDKPKPHFAVVAPIFPVSDLVKSVAYYTDSLLFKTGFEWSDSEAEPVRYAILIHGDTEIHLTQSDKGHKAAAYFFLHGVKEYYDLVTQTGAQITEALQDQPWNMREFSVTDPDGHAIVFGESLERVGEG